MNHFSIEKNIENDVRNALWYSSAKYPSLTLRAAQLPFSDS